VVTLPLTRAGEPEGDRWWLDMCAGPGGKTALLAGLLPAGTRLVAGDLHEHRARLVARTLPGAPRF